MEEDGAEVLLNTQPSGYIELGKGYCADKSSNPKDGFAKMNVNMDWCAKWCNDDKKCTGFSWIGYVSTKRKCIKSYNGCKTQGQYDAVFNWNAYRKISDVPTSGDHELIGTGYALGYWRP
jgi:hypothetical protein